MVDLPTFSVAAIFESVAAHQGVNLACEGMDDDQCYGFVAASDASLVALLQQHALAYDFLIVDGDPVRLVRRPVNDDLTIDLTINQVDCLAQARGPSIKLSRTDPLALPGEVEIAYIDPGRNFAMNTQQYRHPSAPLTAGKLSLATAFVHDADTARQIAVDSLWRLWGQSVLFAFEHPDMRAEPGDVASIVMASGLVYTVEILRDVITQQRTNQVEARLMLTRRGTIIAGGQVDGGAPGSSSGADFPSWLFTA